MQTVCCNAFFSSGKSKLLCRSRFTFTAPTTSQVPWLCNSHLIYIGCQLRSSAIIVMSTLPMLTSPIFSSLSREATAPLYHHSRQKMLPISPKMLPGAQSAFHQRMCWATSASGMSDQPSVTGRTRQYKFVSPA